MQKSWYAVGAALALVFLAINPLAAQPPTTTFNLTGAGSTGANLAGVYTSPYTGTIGSSTTPVSVICDDFSDESYIPETWTAYATPGSTVSSLTPDTLGDQLNWLNTTGSYITVNGTQLDQAQAYTVAAVLAVDILQSTGTLQQDYSFAMWGLFDPCGNGTYGGSGCTTSSTTQDPGSFGQLAECGTTACMSALSSATSELNMAVRYISTNAAQAQADLDAATIYSYETGTSSCSGVPCPTAQPQEFITVNMAEPPSPALLGMDLLGLAGLILIARRFGWLAR